MELPANQEACQSVSLAIRDRRLKQYILKSAAAAAALGELRLQDLLELEEVDLTVSVHVYLVDDGAPYFVVDLCVVTNYLPFYIPFYDYLLLITLGSWSSSW